MISRFQNRFSQAADDAEAYLRSKFASLERYDSQEYLRSWRTALSINGASVQIEICLPSDYPSNLPIIRALPPESYWLHYPHVERSGKLCLIANADTAKVDSPAEGLEYSLKKATELLTSIRNDDFYMEFNSYWETGSIWQRVLSLCSALPLPSNYWCYAGSNLYVISDNIEKLDVWVKNCGYRASEPRELHVVRCKSTVLPHLFPRSLNEFLSFIADHDPENIDEYERHIYYGKGESLVILRIPHAGSFIDAPVFLSGLDIERSTRVQKGYRVGRVPQEIIRLRAAREMNKKSLLRVGVQAVHGRHIHNRGGNGIDLQDKVVTLVGCGSLGGYVAHMLGKSGVGTINLIDKDKLTWDNIGRHILGKQHIGDYKAEALKSEMLKNLPHLSINAIPSNILSVLTENSPIIAKAHLVVSTMGVWFSEYDMNYWGRMSGNAVPLLFAWLEPHCIAGHALFVHPTLGGCLKCGCDDWGQFEYSVIKPDTAPPIQGEGCSGYYQPYGVAEMLPIASMAVAQIVDVLLGKRAESELMTWVSARALIALHAAQLSRQGSELSSKYQYGGIDRREWPASATCRHCG